MTRNELAAMIDHTNLKAFIDTEDMRKLCDEARENGFAMVAINSAQTALCKALLKDTPVQVGAAISFPLGQTTVETKVFETENAIRNGADEIDYVVNQTAVKDGDWAYVRDEMERIVAACRKGGAICKVIFEPGGNRAGCQAGLHQDLHGLRIRRCDGGGREVDARHCPRRGEGQGRGRHP